ncbi:MAG: hypothetical protein KAI71_01990 [Candidatus Pacebacteria bacterium]|nr:hypothetical protein [Candidatus Paceibacterota bacterium]
MNTKKNNNNLHFKFLFTIFFSVIIFTFSFLPTKAIQFFSFSDTVSDSREGVSAVHSLSWSGSVNTLRCIKVLFCTTPNGGCTTPTGLNSTASSFDNSVGLTNALWVFNNTSNGSLNLINALGENPALNVSMEFSSITNPIVSGNFFTRVQTYSDIGCLAQVDYGIASIVIVGQGINVSASVVDSTTTPPSGGGGQIIPVGFASVVLKGKAYPGAYVTILKDGNIAATVNADPSANFESTLTGLPAGIRTFSLWSEDKDGRKSLTMSFTASLTAGTITTFSGLFLPPTIDLDTTVLAKGEILNIFGYTYPKSEVNVFINSDSEIVEKVIASDDGGWLLALDTSVIEGGDHSARSKAVSPDSEISIFSQSLNFKVLKEGEERPCQGADLNFDSKVNLIDFSILLYFWEQSNPSNICADINSDRKVNLIDFSIMMYHWTN